MALTPSEIEKREFKKRLRGYDRAEIHSFLSDVSDEVARLVGELETSRRERDELHRSVEEFREREAAIRETLYSVRALADEIKKEARREADVTLREARLSADRLLQQAREQATKLDEDLSRLRLERDIFEDRVKQAAEEHLRLIEARHREGEIRDRLRTASRRPVASGPGTPPVERVAATGRPGGSGGESS